MLWVTNYSLEVLYSTLCMLGVRSFSAKTEAAEARLSQPLSKCHIVGNLMSWLYSQYYKIIPSEVAV